MLWILAVISVIIFLYLTWYEDCWPCRIIGSIGIFIGATLISFVFGLIYLEFADSFYSEKTDEIYIPNGTIMQEFKS